MSVLRWESLRVNHHKVEQQHLLPEMGWMKMKVVAEIAQYCLAVTLYNSSW